MHGGKGRLSHSSQILFSINPHSLEKFPTPLYRGNLGKRFHSKLTKQWFLNPNSIRNSSMEKVVQYEKILRWISYQMNYSLVSQNSIHEWKQVVENYLFFNFNQMCNCVSCEMRELRSLWPFGFTHTYKN